MTLTAWAALFSVLNAAFQFIVTNLGSLFGKKKQSSLSGEEDAATKAVETTNQLGKKSAEAERESATKMYEDLSNAQDKTDADVDALHDADGVQRYDRLADAIRRANQDVGPDDSVPRTGSRRKDS